MTTLGAKLPITRDSINGFTMIGDIKTLIRQNLKMLILTNPGERVMIPDFGVGIQSYLFENFSNSVYYEIETKIKQQVSKYLPVIGIGGIVFADTHQDTNTLGIQITYSIPSLGLKDLLEFTI
jgi:phage baseplate assembly protein W|tara:strand:+ start:7745 stop:8113 length:369 start_codon:yes stop_codon:yes gene_type:complete